MTVQSFFLTMIMMMMMGVVVVVDGKFEVCSKSHLCLNGGVCDKGVTPSGETIQVCNCEKAVDENGNQRYTGLYCEHEIPEANSMEEVKKDSRLCNARGSFCLNEGTCKEDEKISSCDCPDNYVGAHCEIKNNEEAIQKMINGAGECNMVCQNRGKCQFGVKPEYEKKLQTSAPAIIANGMEDGDSYFYQHCTCPKGTYGTNCEKKLKMCGDDENYCQNGSLCVDMHHSSRAKEDESNSVDIAYSSNSEERFRCDCSASNEKFATVAFAGKQCEVVSTSICSDKRDDFNGKQFCTNFGTCVNDGNDFSKCSCPDGHTGDHCEYGPEDDDELPPVPEEEQCTKTVCQNGGKCQYGQKDHGILTEMIAKPAMKESLSHLVPNNSNENYEHCVCPDGYAGTLCEHQADVCPGGNHICFHGSRCIKEGPNYGCSCNEGNKYLYDDDTLYDDGDLDSDDESSSDNDDDQTNELFGNNYQGAGGVRQRFLQKIPSAGGFLGQAGNGGGTQQQQSGVDLGGTHCQYKATRKCDSGNSCFNDGICYQDKCGCKPQFKGPYCEFPINVKLEKPNTNGSIGNSLYGNNVNNDNDDGVVVTSKCDNGRFCMNDGICYNNQCMCHVGFQGEFCDLTNNGNNDDDDDDNNDDDSVLVTSKCDNGSSCMNGGICYNNRCMCHDGYQGEFCDLTNNGSNSNGDGNNDDDGVVVTSKCDNGSSCFNDGICNENKCLCHDGYQGEFCDLTNNSSNSDDDTVNENDDEDTVDDDIVINNNPLSRCNNGNFCYNGGRCFPDNRCRCKDGFTGRYCQSREDNDDTVNENDDENTIDDDTVNENDDEDTVDDDTVNGNVVVTSKCNNGSFCMNDGMCRNNQCICRVGFQGEFCDLTNNDGENVNENDDEDTIDDDNVNEIDNNDDDGVLVTSKCDNGSSCMNDGICFNNRCMCRAGYQGEFCDLTNNGSNSNGDGNNDDDGVVVTSKCDNGSSCFNDGICNENKCLCHDGYQGEFCDLTNNSSNSIGDTGNKNDDEDTVDDDTVINNNELSRCNNGTFCYNGGRCFPDNKCKCKDGFIGLFCQDREDDDEDTVDDDTFTNKIDDDTVILSGNDNSSSSNKNDDEDTVDDDGFINSSSNKDSRCNDGNFCFNGGRCFPDNRCFCKGGFEGRYCQTSTALNSQYINSGDGTECEDGRICLNGGTCAYNGGCSCRADYVGDSCESYEPEDRNYLALNEDGRQQKGSTSSILFFSFSFAFMGIAVILLILVYTREQKRKTKNINNGRTEERLMESLTLTDDIIGLPTRGGIIENSSNNNSHTYNEDMKIAELI